MKVSYDKDLKIAGIGMTPWPRLGPDIWFRDYKIASLYNWDLDVKNSPEIISLSPVQAQQVTTHNTQALLNNESFQKLLSSRLHDYNLLLYKPLAIKVPASLRASHMNFLGHASNLVSLENKVTFRSRLGGQLPFPDFKILDSFSEAEISEFLDKNQRAVVQHESLSGGKGTFMMQNGEDIQKVSQSFSKTQKRSKYVVSKYIENSAERSLQGCVTRYGTFVGPMQKQIVNNPVLLNPANIASDKFCGAEIAAKDQFSNLYNEMAGYCQMVGDLLFAAGYRGIFGVDFLIDKSQGRIFVLEVNQRITGVTPLLTMLYRGEEDIPFYLLHILEIGNFEYKILDAETNKLPAQGSMLIHHSKSTNSGQVTKILKSGVYSAAADNYLYPDFRFHDQDSHDSLIQRQAAEGTIVKPGGRLVVRYSRERVLDNNDAIEPLILKAVENIYNFVELSL